MTTAHRLVIPDVHKEAPEQHVVAEIARDEPPPPVDTSRERAVAELLTNRPLAPFAALMVSTSDAYDIDWHLLPVIGVLESSGGLNACGGNAWGWGSCGLRDIESFQEGIDVVANTLAAPPYRGQPPETQLCIWVSGNCRGDEASIYVQRARVLWAQLDKLREEAR